MELRDLLGCFILMLAGISLLQFNSITFRKIGMGMIWLASGLAAYYLSDSLLLGAAMLLAWIFFPVWEMLFVLRQLRVPRHRELADARAPRDEFEDLGELTHELVDLGFEQLDECRLEPAQHEQYYQILMREDNRVQATIGFVSQGAVGFHFIAFTSYALDGRRWITWDYPLTYGLVMPPDIAVYRALHCQDVAELYQAHLDFLEINEISQDALISVERTREAVRSRLQDTLNQQIEYNISQGYLAPAAEPGQENFCYSWRGTFYVARQVLKDLLF